MKVDIVSLLLLLGMITCFVVAAVFVIVPYIKLQMRRKASRLHMPQPEEIWMQDDALLYVDSVNPSGIELMSFDPDTKQFHKWKDSWGEWNERLRVRTLWYTGQRRSLGNQ